MATPQSATVMAWVYQIVLWLALPLVWVRLKWRSRREPEYGQRRAERFGQVPADVRPGCVWFHTVSAGETIAAAPLIRTLAEQFQSLPFLVTTMTPTGSAQVQSRLQDCVDHCYAPYDFRFAVEGFYQRVKPRLLVLMETELWPNLIDAAHRRGVPVLLVNARLSARSARGYARIGGLTRPMLSRLSYIACQSPAHVQRFVELGAHADTTAALGSVKYDVELPAGYAQRIDALRERFALRASHGGLSEQAPAQVWIAASTHPGEDEIVLAAFAELRESLPQLRLILVPRHPVRADDVGKLAAAGGFTYVKQSDEQPGEPTDVLIGDVMGTLLELYGLADVAFVGGSLVPVGGHNPLEPALCELPIVSGPHQFNFTDVMTDLAERGALQTVHDAAELAAAVLSLLSDSKQYQAASAAGRAALDENRGASQRLLELLGRRIRTLQ